MATRTRDEGSPRAVLVEPKRRGSLRPEALRNHIDAAEYKHFVLGHIFPKCNSDALETNDSAVNVLGEPTLVAIARELVATLMMNVCIDCTVRENVRAQLRVIVKRILRKHGYPPDKAEKATQTVLEQAEVLSEIWAAA